MSDSSDNDETFKTFTPLFPPGRLVITTDLENKILANGEVPKVVTLSSLRRHLSGDCGDCSDHDKMAYKYAINNGHQILSVYHTKKGLKFWVITEWDRSATTLLLPENY